MAEPVYPANDVWWVKSLRFANLLDDDANKLSPVKLNVWAANLAAISAFAATAATWLGAHLPGVEQSWALVGGWLGQAHATHHFDKRERNLAAVRLKTEG